jgi:phosphopantothenoylcysteine decarboxylase/phosphopantothenate--cysteine ligase|tara:strand:+ start:3725 stop:4291 length:567 start_codon:yes stop_codon:yes gene_type:complete
MGYALAQAAIDRGWTVDLISGPVALPCPTAARLYEIETAEQLNRTLHGLFPPCDVLIMAAAVSDFKPAKKLACKEKKLEARRTLELVPTPDSLLEMSLQKGSRILVGFAAETENLEEHGLRKLQEKDLDWIAVNKVGADIGFQSDDNEILLIGSDGTRLLIGPGAKTKVARDLLDALNLETICNTLSK